ncbi:helix-turn-helix domain-containing protein [Micromonospora sp. WMMD961]|uniref:winged helix-turn-helix transcriptional regulator n=1 Tax=Micromonospora sp. WMMD961 TaxID=3016100 RepID=UPI00241605B0|nr:helix-turn-helix domain-containing protein [Micromonospora sp. WMMD961]MDG4780443.1 helix-turn-helix domain-containing protein [Micromonospora sp. WMMD961]
MALDAVNDRWSLHIVRALAFGASRYTEILRAVGAPRDVLAARLRKLAESGILQARAIENGKAAGYELTQKGKDLGQVILVLKRWGDTYSEGDVPTVDLIHDVCGQVFVAEVRCRACGKPVRSGELSLDQEASGC